MCDVAVAVATFRRPRGLRRLLSGLADIETTARVRVIVADNDSLGHEGFDLCQELKSGYCWDLSAVVVPERGIAQARNALVDYFLAHTDAQFVAMLDDDQQPDPGWLEALLRVQRETGADAVRGSVLREYETASKTIMAGAETRLRTKSGPVEMIDGAGNVLVTRRVLLRMPKPCFDPDFALTGGEDRDFFTSLKRQGARFAYAADAGCREFVPASRSTVRWMLARAYRVGNSDMRVFLKYRPAWKEIVREVAKIAGSIVLVPPWLLVAGAIPRRRLEALRRLCRASGKIAALFGRYYREYATTHGN